MSAITYETYSTKSGATRVKVRLGRRVIGEIRKADGGYRYHPKGAAKWAGDIFRTVAEVQQSLEEI